MIAIIPARGGSKGLPGKNIKMLNGKPLIAYTIEAALNVNDITDVYVTTDSIDIANISLKYGAKVPFLRLKELSTDTASAVDVYLNFIEYLKKEENLEEESFIVLLPTAPLRNSRHIDEAIQLFRETKATTVISVNEAEIPPSWYLQENGKYLSNANLTKENSLLNRQDNKKYYIPNGAIYILNYELLKHKRTYYCESTVGYKMKREESVDIDELLDFNFIEFLINRKEKNNEQY